MKQGSFFDRSLGKSSSVYLIAEIGVNHCGDYDLACETIDAAAKAGADAVKFQSFNADEFMSDKNLQYSYESGGKTVQESMYEMFKRLELPAPWHAKLQRHAVQRGVDFMSSAADDKSASLLAQMQVPAIKLASEDLINIPLLRHVATLKLPVILSTGMAEDWEIERAVKEFNNSSVMLMHCVSLYPTPDEQANILRIQSLADRFGLPVGYSDHTQGVDAAVLAVALGATCVEKHFTLDTTLTGPDHYFSSDPDELSLLRKKIDKAKVMLGNGDIAPAELERIARLDFRRSIVAARPLAAGTVLTEQDLHLQRPHTGLHPHKLDYLIGKTLNVSIEQGEMLSLNMVGMHEE